MQTCEHKTFLNGYKPCVRGATHIGQYAYGITKALCRWHAASESRRGVVVTKLESIAKAE